jgi:DNA-binding transcriptional LysR family regulator
MADTTLALEALQLLDAIARRGSFAAAAQELGRVPSAVTYSVRRLEEQLDVLLFDRRGYRARLTPAGEELLREGRNLLAAADDLVRRVRRIATGWEQELRIALDTAVPFTRLLPLLARFTQAAPTQVRVMHEVLGGTWDALVTGRADLALGAADTGPAPERLSAGCRHVELGRVHFVFCVAPRHPLASVPAPIAPAQLRRHRQVVIGDTSRRLAPRAAGLLDVADVLTVPSMEAKLAAQIAGLGVGHLPTSLAADAIARGKLVARTLLHGRADVDVVLHLAWRGDARGKAVDWWRGALRSPAQRAALTG